MFYRESPAAKLKVYQFSVHAFGLVSSPCVAISSLKLHAKHYADRWPIAEAAVMNNTLVDGIWFMSDSKVELSVGIKEVPSKP